MTSSATMKPKPREGKDWPVAVFMTVLLLVALVGAMLDPSCHPVNDPPSDRLGPVR
jgi:hypothetical protein